MEKSSAFSHAKLATISRSRVAILRRSGFVLILFLLLSTTYRRYIFPQVVKQAPESRITKPFQWSDIKPESSLDFHSCHEHFECARLDVPLDWTAPAELQFQKRAALAVIRLPAKVPVTSTQYGGAILINPGGPGGSGVNLLLGEGREIQTIVDAGNKSDDTGLYYDIIGFDPRGVNHTTPGPSCFPDDAARQFWELTSQAQGMLGSNESFPGVWSRIKALAGSCSERMGEDWDDVGKYMNTPQVATDMVAIIEAMGEWRENKAEDLISTIKCLKNNAVDIRERTKWNKGLEKLQYWGFSYGTVLGSTFASIYPDKVHRVALDGVCDAEDYYAGTWLSNLQDTDSIIDSFLKQCNEAGPQLCPIWSSDGVEGSRTIYKGVLEQVTRQPLPVPASGKYSVDIITRTDVMADIREALYAPMKYFRALARRTRLLSLGNGTESAALKQSKRVSYCRSPTCSDNPYSDACFSHSTGGFMPEISAAILCTDAPGNQIYWSQEDHFNKWQILRGQSEYLGDWWAEITMYCAHWNLRPAWNFTNPDIAAPNGTAHPVLFVSTTRDPVTPLRNTFKMRRRFKGSGLLMQEGDGHCSISAPSLCAAAAIREYFQTGVLPPDGLVCAQEVGPFDEPLDVGSMGEDVREMAVAVERLSSGLGSRRAPLGFW